MPDAVGDAEQLADKGDDAQPDGPTPESGRQRLRTDQVEIEKSPDNPNPPPAESRRFVYHRRSAGDLFHRIRKYEQEHPRPARRAAGDPEADFIDADAEDY
jgi:hypothetical protein